MTSELGVRERKKLAARTALTESAMKLFSENGFDATTVNDIAQLAHMSPRTFFRYFDTKEDVVYQDTPRHLEALRQFLRARPAGETNTVALRSALIDFSGLLEPEHEALHLRAQLSRTARSLAERAAIELQHWRLALTEELMQRPGASDHARCHLLAGVGVHVLTVAISLRSDSESTLPELTAQCWQQLTEVVCSP